MLKINKKKSVTIEKLLNVIFIKFYLKLNI